MTDDGSIPLGNEQQEDPGFPIRVVLTSQYWDCECEAEYIRFRCSQEECPICGAVREEQPDSRVNEVLAAGLSLMDEQEDEQEDPRWVQSIQGLLGSYSPFDVKKVLDEMQEQAKEDPVEKVLTTGQLDENHDYCDDYIKECGTEPTKLDATTGLTKDGLSGSLSKEDWDKIGAIDEDTAQQIFNAGIKILAKQDNQRVVPLPVLAKIYFPKDSQSGDAVNVILNIVNSFTPFNAEVDRDWTDGLVILISSDEPNDEGSIQELANNLSTLFNHQCPMKGSK